MYIKDGIAYAEDQTPPIKVYGVRAKEDYILWLRFSTGEERLFDFKPMLGCPAFAPLADRDIFRDVYIDYGLPVWMDGEIDISPEFLYEKSVPCGAVSA